MFPAFRVSHLARLGVLVGVGILVPPAGAQQSGVVALGETMRSLGVHTRVMMIAAHPDDEDTSLLTWLARGGRAEAAYLSLTRGDGGQNLIGNELGEALGVIRTGELLAARRLDGASQYFTRAYDFGFSKSAEETLAHWNADSLLRDAVAAVRAFRPHVIVSQFTGTRRDGHGQHQVAGMIARQVFDAAADTVRFPPASTGGHPGWTPLKLYQSMRFQPAAATVSFNVGEYSHLHGRSYAEIAAESRSQHKSQGFGILQRKGVVLGHLGLERSRMAGASERREVSPVDGISAGWQADWIPRELRVHADSLLRSIEASKRGDYFFDPAASLAPLTAALRLARSLEARAATMRGSQPREVMLMAHRETQRLERALVIASGVAVEAFAERELLPLGGSVPVRFTVHNRGSLTLRIVPDAIFTCSAPAAQVVRGTTRAGTVSGSPASPVRDSAVTLFPDSSRTWQAVVCAAEDAPVSQPWWLSGGRTQSGAMFRAAHDGVDETGIPEAPVLSATVELGSGADAVALPLHGEVVYRFAHPVRGDVRRPVAIVPPVTITLDRELHQARAGQPLGVNVIARVRSSAAGATSALLRLELPAGLTAEPAQRSIELPSGGNPVAVEFHLRGRLAAGEHAVRAVAVASGAEYRTGFELVDHEHMAPRRIYRPAALSIRAMDVVIPPTLSVAYVPGAGDNVAPVLERLGVPVTVIQPHALERADLDGFTTVVIGPRAYEASPAVAENTPRLLEFARSGGTLVVQYQQYEITREGRAPFPLSIARPHNRVTVEDSPVRILAPADPILTFPHRITATDFQGWVQERALYMPATFAPEYRTLLAMADPGEQPLESAILVAPVGDGLFVYTSIAFFRQLPAGVPGATRLFINLLAAGRRQPAAATDER